MITEHIAEALCLYYLVMGVAFLVNRKRFVTLFVDVMNSQTFMTYSGIIALIVGVFLITIHNVWVWGLPLFVTIVGWLAFLKGAALLIYPKVFTPWTKKVATPSGLLYVGSLMIAFAVLFGYIASR